VKTVRKLRPLRALEDFVLGHLPPAPGRVLEVGCGEGELARAIDAAGYEVVAVDPAAPEGPIFRRIKLEDLDDDERFDAVVASRSFHHMSSLDENLARVATLLGGGGPFVLDEFGWDVLDEATAEWYEAQRRVLLAAGRHPSGPPADEWREHHEGVGVHGRDALLEALDRRFTRVAFEDVPYLWRYLGGPSSAQLEESLIAAAAIRALGFRFVGIARPAATLGK
jgi:SAM-dependent methyltransferase